MAPSIERWSGYTHLGKDEVDIDPDSDAYEGREGPEGQGVGILSPQHQSADNKEDHSSSCAGQDGRDKPGQYDGCMQRPQSS